MEAVCRGVRVLVHLYKSSYALHLLGPYGFTVAIDTSFFVVRAITRTHTTLRHVAAFFASYC